LIIKIKIHIFEGFQMLSDDEKNYFSRQIVLTGFGEAGQIKLKKSRILVAGIGGLGTFSSLILAELGIGYLRIVDRDIIEQSNLHRTPLYTEADLGRAKVEIAAERLRELNPSMIVDIHACHIGLVNIDDLLENIDIVIDGLDNFETRRIINQACVRKGIPYVFCGVSARSGNIIIFNLTKNSPCFSCLYHMVDDSELESCDITGIHPALLPVVTGIQVHEALDILIKGKSSLDGVILFVDLQSLSFDHIPIQKNPNCPICSGKKEHLDITPADEYIPLEICGMDTYMVVPQTKKEFNISSIKNKMKGRFKIDKEGSHSITLLGSNKT
jgi:molybdopterin/thiamine biosynthesis adenylyltransferase